MRLAFAALTLIYSRDTPSPPRWKHADPLPGGSVTTSAPTRPTPCTPGAEDADPRVRRAAVNRIDDLAVLADVARTDPDEDVRTDAVRGLAGLAAEADDPARAIDAVRHLATLGRTREVVVVARENRDPAIRAAVVDLLDEPKALGSISRHAGDAQTRLRALARLTDEGEILNVALKSEHTDTAVAALERIDSPESLTVVAQRARNKVAGRRAKTKVRQIEEAAQPHAAPAVQMSAETHSRRCCCVSRTCRSRRSRRSARALADLLLEGRIGATRSHPPWFNSSRAERSGS